MKAFLHSAAVRSAATGAGAAVLVGASLLATGCSAGQPSSSSAPAREAAPGAPARAPVASGAGGIPAPAPAEPGGARLASLRIQGHQSVIYTASLTVRAADVGAASTRAAQVAVAAGGYVSSEDATGGNARRGRARVSIQLKIPVAAYPASLAALARLGKKLSESQHAEDVTQAVADVTSRVASAKAGIAQLRRLLARAGSVRSLLAVQDRINTEESDLESLQFHRRSGGGLAGAAAGGFLAAHRGGRGAAVRGSAGAGRLPRLPGTALARPPASAAQPGGVTAGHAGPRSDSACTSSVTRASTSGSVSGSTPCPRLNT